VLLQLHEASRQHQRDVARIAAKEEEVAALKAATDASDQALRTREAQRSETALSKQSALMESLEEQTNQSDELATQLEAVRRQLSEEQRAFAEQLRQAEHEKTQLRERFEHLLAERPNQLKASWEEAQAARAELRALEERKRDVIAAQMTVPVTKARETGSQARRRAMKTGRMNEGRSW
jgi:predicted nuclease with TOPRIM domain